MVLIRVLACLFSLYLRRLQADVPRCCSVNVLKSGRECVGSETRKHQQRLHLYLITPLFLHGCFLSPSDWSLMVLIFIDDLFVSCVSAAEEQRFCFPDPIRVCLSEVSSAVTDDCVCIHEMSKHVRYWDFLLPFHPPSDLSTVWWLKVLFVWRNLNDRLAQKNHL